MAKRFRVFLKSMMMMMMTSLYHCTKRIQEAHQYVPEYSATGFTRVYWFPVIGFGCMFGVFRVSRRMFRVTF